MRTVNIHEAKTNLSKLVDRAVKGESFIIAKAGRPLVKVIALDTADAPKPRIGFMKGRITVPPDFDAFGRDEIEGMFTGRS